MFIKFHGSPLRTLMCCLRMDGQTEGQRQKSIPPAQVFFLEGGGGVINMKNIMVLLFIYVVSISIEEYYGVSANIFSSTKLEEIESVIGLRCRSRNPIPRVNGLFRKRCYPSPRVNR